MGKLTMWRFIREQYQTIKPVQKVDLSGKTVVITGGNTGLGFEAAKHFATMNPTRLIIACRSLEKGNVALAQLSKDTGYTNAEAWSLDLNSFASVREFADRFEREGGRLDVLVENAGIMGKSSYEKTADGYTPVSQTNNISPSLHTLLLLPYIIETAEKHHTIPRIVFVSSDVHFMSGMADGESERFANQPNMIDALSSVDYHNQVPEQMHYFDSKLLSVFFVRALQAHLPNSPSIVVNVVNPGYCYSGFRKGFSGFMAFFDYLMERFLALSTEEGGRQLVYAAVGGAGEEGKLKGGYVSFGEVIEPSDFSMSEKGLKLEEKYWTQLLNILKGADPRVKSTIERYLQN